MEQAENNRKDRKPHQKSHPPRAEPSASNQNERASEQDASADEYVKEGICHHDLRDDGLAYLSLSNVPGQESPLASGAEGAQAASVTEDPKGRGFAAPVCWAFSLLLKRRRNYNDTAIRENHNFSASFSKSSYDISQ